MMTIDDKAKDEKLQHDINREQQKYELYHLQKMIDTKMLQAKKYCHLIKVEQQNKQSLHIPLFVKHLQNKQKLLTNERKNK